MSPYSYSQVTSHLHKQERNKELFAVVTSFSRVWQVNEMPAAAVWKGVKVYYRVRGYEDSDDLMITQRRNGVSLNYNTAVIFSNTLNVNHSI